MQENNRTKAAAAVGHDAASMAEINMDYLIQEEYVGLGDMNLQTNQIILGNLSKELSEELICRQPIDYGQWIELAASLLAAPDDRRKFLECASPENIKKHMSALRHYTYRLHCSLKNGTQRLIKFSYHYLSDSSDWMLFTLEDCTEDFETDALTGYYNRPGFVYYASQILKKSSGDEHFAIYFFDICNFKAFNEKYGVDTGDAILKKIANKLQGSFLKPLLTARIQASDSYLCLVKQKQIDEVQLSALCQEGYRISEKMYTIYMKCGVCIVEDKNAKISGLCDRAKLAADQVHDEYYRPFNVFSENMKEVYIAQSDVMGGLNNALENGEFCVYYQPIYDVKTEKIASAEALIRWVNPLQGVMSPGLFIPTLEQNGHILQLDLFVADTVKHFLNTRVEQGKRIVPVSVNLSRVDFTSESGMDIMLDHIRFMAGNSTSPRIEVTESAYTSMVENRSNMLETMQNCGAKILLDDFGNGYSSFSTVTDYDFDIIKLDMGFVQKIGNPKVENIIRAIINMAHDIGARVIAEGAETKEQVDFLRAKDCDYIQGFYYARPLPEKEFERLLDAEEA